MYSRFSADTVGMQNESSFVNQLLIAMPGMEDPNFSASVTLVCEHNSDGALGIIINRPMNLSLGGLFEQLKLQDIDSAMVLGYRHPVGPLKLTDLVGLDVRMHIGEYLAKELSNPAFEPPALMRRLVAEGHLGRKTGKGFYDWPER